MMLQRVVSNLLTRPATRSFPRTSREPAEGYRGAVEFTREDCVFCGACALRCPARAIEVDRPAKTLKFDLFKCIHCACCAEACKKGCVQLRAAYHPPVFDKPEFEFSGAPVLASDGAPAE
jgi:formate hydrogenlyase subunit 6/NADH:ubiquinone oxidoreductase subunit I